MNSKSAHIRLFIFSLLLAKFAFVNTVILMEINKSNIQLTPAKVEYRYSNIYVNGQAQQQGFSSSPLSNQHFMATEYHWFSYN